MPALFVPGLECLMHLQLKSRSLDLSHPMVMGILNVTPDSFFDGGRHAGVDDAVRAALKMVAEGAVIIDIGGESTRPQASPVSEMQELDRVLPVIEALRRETDCVLSIDTMKPVVMREACAAGAELVNDVNALNAPGALEAVRDAGAAVCLMHMQGQPHTMQQAPRYADVVAEVCAYLQSRAAATIAAGVAPERILLDPGFGFGKGLEHNLQLLGSIERCAGLGYPLLVGVSRKSMFQQLLGLPLERRLHASVAAAALAVWQGAAIVRAHDVRATVEAIGLAAAVAQHGSRR